MPPPFAPLEMAEVTVDESNDPVEITSGHAIRRADDLIYGEFDLLLRWTQEGESYRRYIRHFYAWPFWTVECDGIAPDWGVLTQRQDLPVVLNRLCVNLSHNEKKIWHYPFQSAAIFVHRSGATLGSKTNRAASRLSWHVNAHAEIDKLPALPENTSELLAFGYGVSGTSTKPSALPTAMEVEDPDEQVVIFNAPPPLHSRKYVSLATQVEAGIDAALSHLAEAKLLLEQQDSHIRQSQTLHTILRVEGRLAGVMELARCHEMLMTNAEDLHPIPRSR